MKLKRISVYVLLILITLTSFYYYNDYKTKIATGLVSCGGQGGSGGTIIIESIQPPQITGSNFDASGGIGGNCNVYLENIRDFNFLESLSLAGLIFGLCADCIAINDFIQKRNQRN